VTVSAGKTLPAVGFARFTDPVQFQLVERDAELVFAGHLFLKFLDLKIGELDNSPAFRANQMVVMGFPGDIVVNRLTFPEVAFLSQVPLAEEFQGPVHGDDTDGGFSLGHLVVQLFNRNVVLVEKELGDQFSLVSELQAVLAKPGSQ
jgi:hypothetical protein